MLDLPDEILISIFLEFEPLNILPFRRVLFPIYQQILPTNTCISRFVSAGDMLLTRL